MIKRSSKIDLVRKRLQSFPVVAILGPRQCGKTTLARMITHDAYFDLEDPRDLAQFEQPQTTLEKLRGTIVIDEIQRRPELFPLLRVLVDQKMDQRFLILGSASRDLIHQSSETLAGRIAYIELGSFNLDEVGATFLNSLWIRGGYPSSFLAESDRDSFVWRENYVTTFLERDIPQLGIKIPSATLRRFWKMLSHYHAQRLNYSELGRSFGISDMTVKKYIDILVGTFMVRSLEPWHVNLRKRLVRGQKLYFRDSGLFHTLQSIPNEEELRAHPGLGASWEGFAIEQTIQHLGLASQECFFWQTHGGASVDLFWQQNGKNWGIEFKFADAPSRTQSMQSAIEDLKLKHLWVVYPGQKTYPLGDKITVVPLAKLNEITP